MRGLTAEEYELMTLIGCDRQLTLAEANTAQALYGVGRICFERVLDLGRGVTILVVRFTPAGREAMRLHEFLAAMGAI